MVVKRLTEKVLIRVRSGVQLNGPHFQIPQWQVGFREHQQDPHAFKLRLGCGKVIDEAFVLFIPHLSTLTIEARILPSCLGHFICHAAPLEKLDITTVDGEVLDYASFGPQSRTILRTVSTDSA